MVSCGTRPRPSRLLSRPRVGTATNRNRSAGPTSPRATASGDRWVSPRFLHTASPYNEVGDCCLDLVRCLTSPTTARRGGFQHSRAFLPRRAVAPALPGWFAQLGDDVGRQPDPPRAMRPGLGAIQLPGLAPRHHRRDVDVQQLSRGLDAVTPVAALAAGACPRPLRAGAGDLVRVSDPLNLTCGEQPAEPRSKPLLVEDISDLL